MKVLFILLVSFTSRIIGSPQMIQLVSFLNVTAGANQAHLVMVNSAPNINTNSETYEELVAKATRIHYTGWWALFANENYGGASWNTLYRDEPDIEVPEGTLLPYRQSIRHLGAPDTATVSVTAYSGVGFGGSAQLVETENDVPFDVESLFFTGAGTWEFYPGPDQGGDPVTYATTASFRSYPSKADWPAVLQGKVIKSILKIA